MSVRAWGQLYIGDDPPAEDPVMIGSLWFDIPNALLKRCSSVSPYTWVTIGGVGAQGPPGEPGLGTTAPFYGVGIGDFPNGRWVVPGWASASLVNSMQLLNRYMMLPILVSAVSSFDGVTCNVTTPQVDGLARMGIYHNGGLEPSNFKPSTLVRDFGTVNVASLGAKTLTIDPPLILDAGRYWLCWITNKASVGMDAPNIAGRMTQPVSGVSASVTGAPRYDTLRSLDEQTDDVANGLQADISAMLWYQNFSDTTVRMMLRVA